MNNYSIKILSILLMLETSSFGTTLTNLSLESNVTTLNVGETAGLTAIEAYSDGSTKEVAANVEYIITSSDSIEFNGTMLTAKKDGRVTVQAKVGTTLSNILNLNITWVVNGHVLPPEPDPTINNSTLLGIDVNDNGVRDDVERWIYETYDHPIERGIFMQSARAYNLVIVDLKKAHETVDYINDSSSCNYYFEDNNEYIRKKYEYKHMDEELEKIQFNTLKRHMAYERYNAEFSGEVFGSPEASKDKCAFDEQGIFKALK